MIEADPSLPWTPEALAAWRKITDRLESAGQWEEIYRSGAFVTATQCACYLACCRIHGPHADVTRECGAIARLWLIEMAYLDDAVPIPCDDLGRDADIVRLVLEDEPAA